MKRFLIASFVTTFSLCWGQNHTRITPGFDLKNKQVKIITTARNTELRLSAAGSVPFTDLRQPLETEVCVFVDPNTTFQTLLGIGGALTDASAETFARLPKDRQAELLKAYYDTRSGIGYSLGRTNINSCDFSSDTYSYVADNDTGLKSFNIQHDLKYKVPLIKDAIAAAGGHLTMFVSPWSPPAWMKDNKDMLRGGKLLPQFRQPWANYFVKFIRTYEKLGIPVWGLTVQNEPMAKQKWESCIFTAEEERDFVKQYLGPTLQKAGLSAKKIIAWDHNRDQVFQRANTLLSDPQAARYIWGIGYHWYETWTGSDMLFDNLRKVKESYPAVNLFFTEGCIERFRFDNLNDWGLGEKYGYSIINDLNCGTVAWTDWNILLDETGGPNHVGNYCYAPVIADTRDGSLHYTNIYYYIGHISKFVRPGAKRVACSSNRDKLITTSFLNTDGSLAVIVMNRSDEKIAYKLWIKGKAANVECLPHSINTLLVN